MSIYKGIENTETSFNEIEVYKEFKLDKDSDGIEAIQYRSGSYIPGSNQLQTLSGSYWDSLLVNFYFSGSDRSKREQKFNQSVHSFGIHNTKNPQHRNKFHASGSVLLIPQKYFGDGIKKESFVLTDTSNTTHITIKDDGYGNLYPTNAELSQSNCTSISSSDNYVGNIFYDYGVVTITETGSYGGVWNLSSAVHETTSTSSNAQNNLPYGFFWKPDGKTLWIIGSAGTSEIFEFNVSASAWDVGSTSYSGNSWVLNYSNARDVSFRDDGLKMYSLSGNTDKIYEHNLSTAWDITSITTTSQSFEIKAMDDAPYGFYFKDDGLKVYTTGREHDKVYEMNMSTAWDISSITTTSQSYAHSASIAESLSVTENEIGGITFHPNGKRMYTTGDKQNLVYEHRLSTAWDITTATYHTSKSVVDEENRITSVQWKPDGSKMYILGFGADMIDQYNMPSASFYRDILTSNYDLQFNSKQTIFPKEYTLVVRPHEFNHTNNPTARELTSGSGLSSLTSSFSPLLRSELTASGWTPYMTTIGLYRENDTDPVMIAKYPQPIKMRNDMTLIFKIIMDW